MTKITKIFHILLNTVFGRFVVFMAAALFLIFGYGLMRLTYLADFFLQKSLVGDGYVKHVSYEGLPILFLQWETILERFGLIVREQICCEHGIGFSCYCYSYATNFLGGFAYVSLPSILPLLAFLVSRWIFFGVSKKYRV